MASLRVPKSRQDEKMLQKQQGLSFELEVVCWMIGEVGWWISFVIDEGVFLLHQLSGLKGTEFPCFSLFSIWLQWRPTDPRRRSHAS